MTTTQTEAVSRGERNRNSKDRPGDEAIELSLSSQTEIQQPYHGDTDSRNPQLELTLSTSLKLSSSAFCFLVAGVNDGSLGALVPYILRGYGIGTGSVAVIWGTSFAGWAVAAATGGYMREYIGLGGTLIVGAMAQLLSHVLRFWEPPFELFVVTFIFAAVGQGYQDAQANTFVATLKDAHRWLGVIHASYSVGCLIGPLVASSIASQTGRWMYFYLFPTGLGALNLGFACCVFRDDVSIFKRKSDSRQTETETGQSKGSKAWSDMKITLKSRVVWLISLFYFFYLGVALTVGGWLVEYLVEERNGQLSKVGYVPTGYFGGIVIGRLLLPEPIHRLGEKPVILICSVFCLVLQIIFWRVNNIIVNAVVVSVFGFLSGPFFATGMSVASKLIQPDIHTTALGLIFVIAQAGGTVFPAITGVIAAKAGVGILQPILIGLIVVMGVSWALVPSVQKKRD